MPSRHQLPSTSCVTSQSGLRQRETLVPPWGLAGVLSEPERPRGLVVFAHGSGSSRFSRRNIAVAQALGEAGFTTLLFDLLTPQEEHDRANVFDIPRLAERLVGASEWLAQDPALSKLPLGFFGASTGAAAALVAASRIADRARAVVSRGGRPDLAAPDLSRVRAPTLLIVGGDDDVVVRLNEQAMARMTARCELQIIPGASHLFPEPGALEAVIRLATAWFARHLAPAAEVGSR